MLIFYKYIAAKKILGRKIKKIAKRSKSLSRVYHDINIKEGLLLYRDYEYNPDRVSRNDAIAIS